MTQRYQYPHKLIAIVGATASGKSSVAIELARRFNAEIISVDSLQIYKYFDIGTGKITFDEKRLVNHHLIDIVTPEQLYDAAKFQKDADAAIRKITERGKNIILAGGAGLYLRALLRGLFQIPSDPIVREQLKQESEDLGLEILYKRLQKIDEESTQKISQNDAIRIIRALEVYQITGETFSALSKRHQKQDKRYEAMILGLSPPRPILFERINQRVESMLAEGWAQEVEMLRFMGYSPELKAMQAIGYREINMVLNGTLESAELLQRIQRQTRLYAKRQMTWFRKENVTWYESGEELLKDPKLEVQIREFFNQS